MRGQPHGIAGANSDHKGEEPAQEKRRRRKSSQKPHKSEDFGEGAEEAVVHLLPQYQGPECEEMDIDMFFLPLALDKVGALSIFWNTQQAPAMKVFSERPNFLQLFHQPLALFVQMPEGAHPQAWKAEVCRALHSQGVEVPIPTSSNPFNGSCIVRRNVKCHWGSVAPALRNLGLDVVHIGQYGCKVPLQYFKDSFEMGQPLQEGSAFDIAFQRRHTESIVLFGLQGGRGEVEVCGKPCKAYIHKILPGMVAPEDQWEWGTLEMKMAGRAGSEQQKYLQAYSPTSHLIKAAGQYECRLPETMKALRGRKRGLLNLVHTIMANAFAGSGFRVEVRVRHNMATSLEEGVSLGQSIMKQKDGDSNIGGAQ